MAISKSIADAKIPLYTIITWSTAGGVQKDILNFLVLWALWIYFQEILIGQLMTCDPGTKEKSAHGGQTFCIKIKRKQLPVVHLIKLIN